MIICESTVSRWFEILETIFLKPMFCCCDLLNFDRVFQYSAKSLKRLLREELKDVARLEQVENIGMGKYILFLGRKVPSWMLPCNVTFYLIRKDV